MESGGKRSLESRDGDQSSLEPAHKPCKVENSPVSYQPNEMLAAVFGHLPTGDKGKAALVCQLWSEVLDITMLWKETHVAIDMDTITEESLSNLKKRQVSHLTITACLDVMKLRGFLQGMPWLKYLDLRDLKSLSHQIRHDLFSHDMPAMKVLYMPCSGTQYFSMVAEKMRNLEIFFSEECECSPPDQRQVSFQILSSSPMQFLQKLYIPTVPLEDDDLGHLQAGLPNVKSLWISLSPEASETGMQKVAEMASLEVLYLKGASASQNISIGPLSTGKAKIQCLHLQYEVSEANARSLATMNYLKNLLLMGRDSVILECLTEGLPNLRVLQLFCFREMVALGMTALAKMVQLKHLILGSCNVDNECLRILSNGPVELSMLDLLSCHNFTDKGLEYVGNMRSLHTLGLFDCMIGDNGLLGLSQGTAPLACLKVGQCSGITHVGRQTFNDNRQISTEEHSGHSVDIWM